KRGRQDIEMPDRKRQPTERPDGADHEGRYRRQGEPEAAINNQVEHGDAQKRQPRREAAVVLRGDRLVVFQHRQAGQTDLEVAVFFLHLGDQFPKRIDVFLRVGKADLIFFLHGVDEQKRQLAVAREEILRLGELLLLARPPFPPPALWERGWG